MLAWVLHRVSGIAIVVFVGLHVLASFLMQQFGSDFATTMNIVYESPYFQIFIFFVVIWHALNGLRIIILDTWPRALQYQREATWLQWIVFLAVYATAVTIMVMNLLGGE
jgi:succinate dehydrogenase / fumarate reductase cytochrome b subunit